MECFLSISIRDSGHVERQEQQPSVLLKNNYNKQGKIGSRYSAFQHYRCHVVRISCRIQHGGFPVLRSCAVRFCVDAQYKRLRKRSTLTYNITKKNTATTLHTYARQIYQMGIYQKLPVNIFSLCCHQYKWFNHRSYFY